MLMYGIFVIPLDILICLYINYFKELWQKFIELLQDKFFSSDKYDDIIDELHEEEIIDDNDLDIIKNELFVIIFMKWR